MLVEAGEAARRTSWEAKRITMGQVLAHAMSDDADIDYDAALLSALAALEAVHFRYLGQIAADPPTPWTGPKVSEPYGSQLIAQGVVVASSGGVGVATGFVEIGGVSEFGHRLMEWIREAESDLP